MDLLRILTGTSPKKPAPPLPPAGTYKALLIGVNYAGRTYMQNGASAELEGSHRDVLRVKDMLKRRYPYHEQNITVLLDDGVHMEPTRVNMVEQMHRLVANAQSGDHFFFHFSGHGVQVEDLNGDEADGLDEAIWPSDYIENQQETYIIDDDLKQIMVDPLPPGCQLTALFDSCHSGTVLDLPVEHKGTPRANTINLPPSPIDTDTPGMSPAHSTYSDSSTHTVLRMFERSSLLPLGPPIPTHTEASHGLLGLPYSVQIELGPRARGKVKSARPVDAIIVATPDHVEPPEPRALVTSWAACADEQNAYEVRGGEGAMVQYFLESIDEIRPENLTFRRLLESLDGKLSDYCARWNHNRAPEDHITQVPQLGSLHDINLDDHFAL